MGIKKYNPEIDLVKFIFSVFIVLYHSNKLVAATGIDLFSFGFTATDFFFMISGYLMVKSSKKYDPMNTGRSTFDFVMSKIKSFYPYLIFAFIVAFAVRQYAKFLDGTFIAWNFWEDLLISINEVLLLQNSGIDFGSIYNGPTWYISAMLISMAVLFPILLKCKDWFVNIGSLIMAIFAYAFTQQERGTLNALGWNGFTSRGIVRAIAGLCLGVFLCSLVEKYQAKGTVLKTPGKILVGITELGVFVLLVAIMQKKVNHRFDYIAIILIFYLCFVILSGITGFSDLLPSKICAFLGKASLLIYLNHRCLVFLFNALCPELRYGITMTLYLAGAVVMAFLAEGVIIICRKIGQKVSPCVKKALVE